MWPVGKWPWTQKHMYCMYVSWSVEQDYPHLINVIYCISLAVASFLSSDVWHDEHSFVTTLTPSVIKWRITTLGTEVKARRQREFKWIAWVSWQGQWWLNKSRSKQEWCCLCEQWIHVWVYKRPKGNTVLNWGKARPLQVTNAVEK